MNLVKRAAQQVGAGMSLSDFDRVLDSMYGGQPSYTGKLVSQQTALAVSAVWSCTNILSGDIATLPFVTYRYVKDGREPAKDHYLWSLLQQETNPEITAFRFKQMMQTWLCLWGNAYAEIEISGRGQVTALWPWRPDRVSVSRAGGPMGPLQYTYRMQDGKKFTVPRDRMLHLRGFGTDGVLGLSPIEIHRQTVGLSLAVTEHGGRLFGNGAVPLGVIQHPSKLGPKAEASLRSSWMAEHGGLENAHRIAILEEGMKYTEVGLKPVDSKYIEILGLTNEDVARIYNVPQHRIGLLERSTNNNIEQQALEYVQFTLGPLAENWHQELEMALLSLRERQQITVRPNYLHLLRGDHAAMAVFIGAMVDRGIVNADEVRENYLDMNAQADGVGKDYYKALNVAPVQEDNFGKGMTPMQKVTPKNKPADKVNGLAH